ncbi:conserved membrane hypothetical protein [Crenothrix polyspora]|uniref:DUF1772 domain-containing protein n=1 Tax=Crenothrix polyspora TaxID=360316 RepID=A0A1R4H274_9GAMM|nr:hypothetical protein [Crenothrix polyspora]SJM90276.1 conserved membrane hypothetical protein [Crenothrix polyspora]
MPIMLFRTFTILLVALLTGLAFAHVLELPAKMQYEAAMYIALQKSLYVQWGPPNVGGVLEPAAIIATALIAFFGRNNKRGLWLPLGALAALLTAFPVVFFVLVAPANAGFMATTLPSIPVNWTEFRANWELGHVIRFGLQFSALSLLVLLLALDAKDIADIQRSA